MSHSYWAQFYLTLFFPPIVFIFIFLNVIIFSFKPSRLLATTFIPLSIETQVQQSDLAIRGHVIKKRVVYSHDLKMAVTEYYFQVVESMAYDEKNLPKMFEVKVLVPGGHFQGHDYYTVGAPHFNINEEAFVILKKIKDEFWVSNLSLGKYKVLTESDDSSLYLKSSVFTYDKNLNHISGEYVKKLFKFSLNIKNKDKNKNKDKTQNLNKNPIENRSVDKSDNVNSQKMSKLQNGDNSNGHKNSIFEIIILASSLVGFILLLIYFKFKKRNCN